MHNSEIRVGEFPHDPGRPGSLTWIVAMMVVAGGAAPVLLYWLLFGWIPTVTPDEAKRMLREPKSAAALVDVRDPALFAAGHIDGAVNWPLSDIVSANNTGDVPVSLANQTLLLVCDVGMASRLAAWRLGDSGLAKVFNVRGGNQEWMRSYAQEIGARFRPTPADFPELLRKTDPPHGELFDRWRIGADRVQEFPFRLSPLGEQVAAVLAYFFIKPVYMLLSLALAVLLWKRQEPDLTALRWSMLAFFLGEGACAVNYGLFRETSYLFEYLHSFGMLCAFGFFFYAFLEGIDRRILRISASDQRCAALGLCRRCMKNPSHSHREGPLRAEINRGDGTFGTGAKHTGVPCGLQRTFVFLTAGLIIVAMMVPTADWQDGSYNTYVFGQLYHYAHLRVFQQFENWYCPLAAVLCLATSLTILVWSGDVARAKIPFAAGVGALGFGMLRMILGSAYDQNRVWFLFWEEGTEMLFIAGIGVALWIFRQGLFPISATRESPHPSEVNPSPA